VVDEDVAVRPVTADPGPVVRTEQARTESGRVESGRVESGRVGSSHTPSVHTESVHAAASAAAHLLHRPHLSARERERVLDALMVDPGRAALQRFTILLTLSVLVAAVGLLQDSTAVVIGAMMIAPLMAPIMGIAASVVMGWGRRLLTGVVIVLVAVLGAVGLAWLIAVLLPAAGTGLPTEVLARSSPDLRDLLVAIAAGAAGAYATVRRQALGAMPGVAVAVALVPPLACVGVLLGDGQPGLARGALLLFVTNLVGIVLAAAVTFVLTGFVPTGLGPRSRRRTVTVLTVTAVPALLVGAVLSIRFVHLASAASDLEKATRTVVGRLASGEDLSGISMTGDTVQIDIASSTTPPTVTDLSTALTAALGRTITVDLRWTPLGDPDSASTASAVPALDEVRPLVETWLTEQELTLTGIGFDGSTLVVSTSGDEPPTSGDDLSAVLAEQLGVAVPVGLSWTASGVPLPSATTDTLVAAAQEAADTWAADQAETAIAQVERSQDTLTVTVVSTDQPDITDLREQVRAAVPQLTIVIQWVPGRVLDRSTPSASPSGPDS